MTRAASPFATAASSEAAKRNHALWLEHAIAENRRELDRLLATLRDDCVYEVVPTGRTWRGKDEVAEFYRGLWSALPDVKLDLLGRIDADDCVVEESVVRGTLSGDLFGFPSTGGPLRLRVVIFFPVREGAFAGERVYFDAAELARQVPAAASLGNPSWRASG